MAGLIVTLEVSVLASAIVTPIGPAGLVRVTGRAADCPAASWMPAAIEMLDGALTTTLVVAFGTLGAPAAAVIVADPGPAAVIGMFTAVLFAANAIDGGTVAAAELLELRVIASPAAGAGDERLRTTFCVPDPLIVSAAGAKLRVAPTCTS